MPFSHPVPRSFNSQAIHEYAPNGSGIYGISNKNEWIYIGESDNIQRALLEHLMEVNSPLQRREPTGFVFDICAGGLRVDRQGKLIMEYGPTCNRPWARQRHGAIGRNDG